MLYKHNFACKYNKVFVDKSWIYVFKRCLSKYYISLIKFKIIWNISLQLTSYNLRAKFANVHVDISCLHPLFGQPSGMLTMQFRFSWREDTPTLPANDERCLANNLLLDLSWVHPLLCAFEFANIGAYCLHTRTYAAFIWVMTQSATKPMNNLVFEIYILSKINLVKNGAAFSTIWMSSWGPNLQIFNWHKE